MGLQPLLFSKSETFSIREWNLQEEIPTPYGSACVGGSCATQAGGAEQSTEGGEGKFEAALQQFIVGAPHLTTFELQVGLSKADLEV